MIVAVALVPSPIIGILQTLPVVAVMMVAVLILLVLFAVPELSRDLPLGLSCGLSLYTDLRVQGIGLVSVVR